MICSDELLHFTIIESFMASEMASHISGMNFAITSRKK